MDLVNKNWERTIMETWGADYCNDCNPKLDMRKKSGKNQPNKMGDVCRTHQGFFGGGGFYENFGFSKHRGIH